MFHVKRAVAAPRTTRFPSPPQRVTTATEMLIYGSCASRAGRGVLLIGAPGSGKSDLLLRLFDAGFALVADDRVEIDAGCASPPPALAGLMEVRGLGIVRLPFEAPIPLALAVQLERGERLPQPARHKLGVPLVMIDPTLASAPARIRLALDCALGSVTQLAGAFA